MIDFGLLNQILDQFQLATRSWYANIYPYSLRLVFFLAAIELAWCGLRLAIDRETGLPHFFNVYLRKLIYLSFVAGLVAFANYWMPLVPSSFAAIAARMTGIGALHPSSFFSTGIQLALTTMTIGEVTGVLVHPLSAVVTLVVSIGVFAAFTVMAGALLYALVESYILLGGCAIFLPFAATRWTYHLAESYFATVVRVGVRLLLIYLVTGVIASLATSWATALIMSSAAPPLSLQLAFIGAVWVAAVLVLTLPRALSHALIPASLHLGLNPAIGDN